MRKQLFLAIKGLAIAFTIVLCPRQSDAAWSNNNTVNTAITTAAGNQYTPRMATDGGGGAIIVWEDYRNGDSDIYARRIDADGTVLWTADGLAVTTATGNQSYHRVVSDGSGGAIITWQDDRNGSANPDIYAQRIDAGGTVQWTANGVAIVSNSAAQHSPQLINDGSGGAIITWADNRRSSSYADIYAQRIDANGAVQWTADGVIVSTTTTLRQWSPQIVTDGSGGAIIAWGLQDNYYRVYGQRVNGSGVKQWVTGPNGASITGFNSINQLSFAMASDGSGGAVFCWLEGYSGPSWGMRAQLINGSGAKQWGAEGVAAAAFGSDAAPIWNMPSDLVITGDGLGGGIFAWTDYRSGESRIYAKRVAVTGSVQWAANGTQVYPAMSGGTQIIGDGSNGAILTWTDAGSDTRNIFAQRYDVDGNFVWWTAVSMAASNQTAPQIVGAGNGKSIFAWMDERNGLFVTDIYAQKVLANGTLPVRYQLTANAGGNGAGSVSASSGGISYAYPAASTGSAQVDSGDAVTLTATAATGSTVAWTGDCSTLGGTATNATCTIASMDAAKTVTATFTLNQYTLTANAAGNGAGSMTSSTGGINFAYPAESSGAATLDHGTPVTLTASAAADSTVAWSGDCSTTGGTTTAATCTISGMAAARTVTATFSTYLLTVKKADTGRGVIATSSGTLTWNGNTGTGSYRYNTTVTLTATATGSTFGGWTGCDSSNGLLCTVAMTAAKSVTATFYAAWSSDPRLNTPICTATGEQNSPHMAGDGSGGTIITWTDNRSGTRWDIYAQRVDANGAVMWTYNGVALAAAVGYDKFGPRVASDGSGGAIIAWYDRRNGEENFDVFAQRIDGSGVTQWAAEGVAVSTAPNHQDDVKIVSDGSGGAIISWKDGRSDYRIYAQRVDGSGAVQWAADGIPVCLYPNTQQVPEMVADGSGGAIIAWLDARDNRADFFAQRIDGNGSPLWAADGLFIATSGGYHPLWRTLAGDGAGGAVFAWGDTRNGEEHEDLYAQRVDAAGALQWTAGGLAISTVTSGTRYYLYPRIAIDDAGGAVLTWQDNRSGTSVIYTQRVAADGTVLWAPDGVALTSGATNQYQPIVLAEGGNGGAILGWTDGGQLFSQRVDATGTPEWAANGISLSNSDCQKSVDNVVSDGNSGAIFAWMDYRTCVNRELDIYAQKVSATGMPAVDGTAPTVTAFTIPATSTAATITINSFTATDNVAVTGYCLTETVSSSGCAWSASAPASYSFSAIPDGIATDRTLYGWARDETGNVSTSVAASVTITLPDVTAPSVTAFVIPADSSSLIVAISTFTATDNVAVAGYCLTETNSSGGCSWTTAKPASVTVSGVGTITIHAWARDAAGNISTAAQGTVTVSIAATPTDVALSAASVTENSSTGAAVGTLSTTDPNAGDTFTYTLVAGTGSTDNASFTIAGNALATAAVFNFEARSTYGIRVRSTDQGGLFFEKAFTITVTDVNEPPTDILLSSNIVNEGALAGATVGTLSTTDPDSGDTFTYSIVGGETAMFSIDGNQLRTFDVLDFAVKNPYTVRIRSTDSGLVSMEKDFTVLPPSYVLWTRSDTGQAALWKVNPGTGAVLSGVFLGPAGGIGAPWQAASYAHVSATVGYLLWTRSDTGVAALWQVNPVTGAVASGVYVNGGYGIGSPWQATSYAHASGTSGEVLWTRSDTGQAALWTINPGTGAVVSGVYLGPASGIGTPWQATSYTRVSATEGYVHWTRSDYGRAASWEVDPVTGAVISGVYLGPASGIGSPWQATSHARVSATSGEVLWTRSDTGQAALWTINPGTGAVLSGVYLGPAGGIGAPWQATSHIASARIGSLSPDAALADEAGALAVFEQE